MQVGARGLRLAFACLAVMPAVAVAGCGSSKTSTSTPGTASAQASSSASSTTSSSMGSGMAKPARSATCVSPGFGSQTVKTGRHVFILSVGPPEPMYSSRQARRMHPKRGEIMFMGHMQGPGMGDMSAGDSMAGMDAMRHLEVHICSRQGDKVVTAPLPTITLTSGSESQVVPVVEMEGIGEGLKDFHFGNNVQLMRGATYTVDVRETHEHVVFHVKLS